MVAKDTPNRHAHVRNAALQLESFEGVPWYAFQLWLAGTEHIAGPNGKPPDADHAI